MEINMDYEDFEKLFLKPEQFQHNPEFVKIQKEIQEKLLADDTNPWAKINKDWGDLANKVVGCE